MLGSSVKMRSTGDRPITTKRTSTIRIAAARRVPASHLARRALLSSSSHPVALPVRPSAITVSSWCELQLAFPGNSLRGAPWPTLRVR